MILTYPSTFTVPIGMNYYVTYCAGLGSGGCLYNSSGSGAIQYTYSHGQPVIPEGTTLQITCGDFISGILVNKNPYIQIIDVGLTGATTYTVPSGKTLFIKSFDTYLRVNGLNPGSVLPNEQMLIVPGGTVISVCCSQTQRITGYLR